jgi:hypothetical protein
MIDLSGYSVARVQRPLHDECFYVYRDNMYVACISSLGEMFNNRLAFDWHDKAMWRFSASDFVTNH